MNTKNTRSIYKGYTNNILRYIKAHSKIGEHVALANVPEKVWAIDVGYRSDSDIDMHQYSYCRALEIRI